MARDFRGNIEIANRSAGRSTTTVHDRVLRELDAEQVRGDVLDYGAGTGELAANLARRPETRVTAADLVEFGSRPAGVQWLTCDLNDSVPAPDSSFDGIVAVGVLEYLENPWAATREWHRLLRPGGIVILTVPNAESWRSLLSLVVRGRFVAVDPARGTGINALLRADIALMLESAGFDRIRFFHSGRGVVPRLTELTWQTLSAGRLRGLRTSDDLGGVARKPLA